SHPTGGHGQRHHGGGRALLPRPADRHRPDRGGGRCGGPSMTPAVLRQIGADLQPIGLAELVERAALQTRVDRKYVVPLATVGDLITHLGSAARILEIDRQRSFRYESVYFDTPQLTSYLQTARRRLRRFMV